MAKNRRAPQAAVGPYDALRRAQLAAQRGDLARAERWLNYAERMRKITRALQEGAMRAQKSARE